MDKTKVKTADKIEPKIYAYSTEDVDKLKGWHKIGYTEQPVLKRIREQRGQFPIKYEYKWDEPAFFEDNKKRFDDHVFHAYLKKLGVERYPKSEWFNIGADLSKQYLNDFRRNHGHAEITGVSDYNLREEQRLAVEQTANYFKKKGKGAEFLWNAKPRFGKTLSSYDLIKKMDLSRVLIVTNRPAIANSWFDDYAKFMGTAEASGYVFISETDALKGTFAKTRAEYEEYLELHRNDDEIKGFIEFESLQNLKGAKWAGGEFDKLNHIKETEWDLLIIDEAHEGADTFKTEFAFHKIPHKYALHLSGTPFKALANEKFPADAIYNWTYADEQTAKEMHKDDPGSPYLKLPNLNLFTYKMSDIALDKASKGIEIEGKDEQFAFDLNEFFAVNDVKSNSALKFEHDQEVDKFLDALASGKKFPFSEEYRDELKHTVWLLDRVNSAKALAAKLKAHPVFQDYEIVIAAGDGKEDENDREAKNALDRVRKAIAENEKTITLTVGQLTTGITVPEWTAVLMLSNVKSPAKYMQAAFRAQNPWSYEEHGEFKRKTNAYVFDFDPARTLEIYEQMANNLFPETAGGLGTKEDRLKNIAELINFFPVIAEDEDGEMIELDAAQVLSVPRAIRSAEVVRRGFISDFLFQNISRVFLTPALVEDIITNIPPVKEKDLTAEPIADENTAKELYLNEEGEFEMPEEIVIGKTQDVFGDGIYKAKEDLTQSLDAIFTDYMDKKPEDLAKKAAKQFANSALKSLNETAKENGTELKGAEQTRWQARNAFEFESKAREAVTEAKIKKGEIEKQTEELLVNANTEEEKDLIINEANKQAAEADSALTAAIEKIAEDSGRQAALDYTQSAARQKSNREKKTKEERIKDHLRGFTRTIPSFIMAYGDENLKLSNFDEYVNHEVFKELTGITMEQFKLLRDGGEAVNEDTGELERFDGHLFDELVFDDSVKEFLNKKELLKNYFDENQNEDIFSYIPPQRTNQIFTPKTVVKDMADKLEEENPGCFDDPEATFADLYMKSGLYITEIVKRLFKSDKLKELYPNEKERLNHIFANQVYGCAPTEIIYRICRNYILGFADGIQIEKNNIRRCDMLKYAKNGTLEDKLEEMFGM